MTKGDSRFQVDMQGAKGDLHSKLYGDGFQNPLHAIVELLATLTIAVEGFYDNVRDLTTEEPTAYEALGFDEDALKNEIDVSELFGEKGFTNLYRLNL